jgi:hypothetical protein
MLSCAFYLKLVEGEQFRSDTFILLPGYVVSWGHLTKIMLQES